MLFVVMILLVYRLGAVIPVPFVNSDTLAEPFNSASGSIFQYLNIMSGEAFSRATLFALSVQPYITASIVMQLLTIAIPALERLQSQGEEGRKKITTITRYVTVGLGLVTAYGYYAYIKSTGALISMSSQGQKVLAALVIIACYSAGSALVMWMAEKIYEFGIGNGISIVLVINIISRLPQDLGNLFQQLYNTADSLIVGNFLGSNALAAVSSSGNLIFLMVGFINGIAMGAGVVIARYYGAKKRDCLKKAIHTTVAFGLVAGAVLTVLGMFLAPKILVLMGTPADVLPESIVYFRTYFAGSMGVVMYNIFVGVLQSVGDGRHPLIYLIISSCVNVVLDIFFIAGLGMGVGSAALATAISQFVSALLCMVHLLRVEEEYRLELREIRFDSSMLKQIIQNGVPSGFQNSVIAIANVFVQSNINAFGKMAMAGCGSYSKIEGFAFLPVTCFTMALTTFVSQNLGAKQYDRAKKGARFGVLCSITIAELIGIIIYVAAPVLITAFNRDPDVVHYGVMQSRTIALFYCLLAFSHCIAAILRGSGNASVPMIVMLCDWCLFRVSYITVAVRILPDIRVIFWAYPLTWGISSVIFLYLFLRGKWVYGFEKS